MFNFATLDDLRASDIFDFAQPPGPGTTTSDRTITASGPTTTTSSVAGSTTVTTTLEDVIVDIAFDLEGTASGMFEGSGTVPTGTVSVSETVVNVPDARDAMGATVQTVVSPTLTGTDASGPQAFAGIDMQAMFAAFDRSFPNTFNATGEGADVNTMSFSTSSSFSGSVRVSAFQDDVDVVLSGQSTGNAAGFLGGRGTNATAVVAEFERFGDALFDHGVLGFDPLGDFG